MDSITFDVGSYSPPGQDPNQPTPDAQTAAPSQTADSGGFWSGAGQVFGAINALGVSYEHFRARNARSTAGGGPQAVPVLSASARGSVPASARTESTVSDQTLWIVGGLALIGLVAFLLLKK